MKKRGVHEERQVHEDRLTENLLSYGYSGGSISGSRG